MNKIKEIEAAGYKVASFGLIRDFYNEYWKNILRNGFDVATEGICALNDIQDIEEWRLWLPDSIRLSHFYLITYNKERYLVYGDSNVKKATYAILMDFKLEIIESNYTHYSKVSVMENVYLTITEGKGWTYINNLIYKYSNGLVRMGNYEIDYFTDFELCEIFKYILSDEDLLVDYDIKHELGEAFMIDC